MGHSSRSSDCWENSAHPGGYAVLFLPGFWSSSHLLQSITPELGESSEVRGPAEVVPQLPAVVTTTLDWEGMVEEITRHRVETMREKEVCYFQYLAGLFRLTQAVQQSAQQALVEAEATLRGDDCEEDLMESTGLGDDERDLVEEEDEAFTRQITNQDFFA